MLLFTICLRKSTNSNQTPGFKLSAFYSIPVQPRSTIQVTTCINLQTSIKINSQSSSNFILHPHAPPTLRSPLESPFPLGFDSSFALAPALWRNESHQTIGHKECNMNGILQYITLTTMCIDPLQLLHNI